MRLSCFRSDVLAGIVVSACLPCAALSQVPQSRPSEQPPPFTVPNPPTPAATQAPGQQTVPAQQQPNVMPDAPLPRSDQSTVDDRALTPLAAQSPAPKQTSPGVAKTSSNATTPPGGDFSVNTHWYSLVGPYRGVHIPDFVEASTSRIDQLVHDGKLYLSLHDALTLAIENNLDVAISRYEIPIANTDLLRARGGGNLRGIDYTITQTPEGVGQTTNPLLITATNQSGSPTNVNIVDLSQVTQSGSSMQQNLGENGTSMYSAGPPVPLYDPNLVGEASYLQRSDQVSLISTTSTTTGSSSSTGSPTGTQRYISAGLDYVQGFSSGAQLEAFVDNSAQVLYSAQSQYDPFHAVSSSLTFTQPLLRGRGREVNLRFVHIASLNQKVSRLLFEQQLLETIYGVARLYYDLVSLGENIGVKEQSVATAQRLYDDDKLQVDEGTLAPIELTRARALLSSSRLDLIQAQGEYRQQEVILRQQLIRRVGDPAISILKIIPTDHITIPDDATPSDVDALTRDALANRPDLAQAALQVQADEIAARATRNGTRPSLSLYGNVQTRGASLVPLESIGSPGTGMITTPPAELTQGGLRLSTIYQGGVQLNMPLRNRVAQADSARDEIQLRQAQGRTVKLENDVRQQVENSTIALETAHQAYAASVESSNYQQQLLQAEIDKFAVGESTNYMIVQDQSYLAQARSTEVAARSNWMKAKLSLDRALGNLLEQNQFSLDDAIRDQVR